MMIWKTLDIGDTERVLIYRHGRLRKIGRGGRVRVLRGSRAVTYSVNELRLNSTEISALWAERKALLQEAIQRELMTENQLGLVYRENRLIDVIAPGQEAFFWLTDVPLEIVKIDLDRAGQIPTERLAGLARLLEAKHVEATKAIKLVEVPEQHFGALYVDGQFVRELSRGRHGFAAVGRNVQVKVLDLRMQFLDVSGQEILTRDRVSLRLNVSVAFQVAAPERVLAQVPDTRAFVYRTTQLALRETVGERDLDELLAQKDALNSVLDARVRQQLTGQGYELRDIGVKDVILPGEMRAILNQVVEAQKAAEANVIRRREETQAMRALHNTAKMMEGNPILLRLKELEALEQVSGRIGQLSVYGGLEGLLRGLVTLEPRV